MSIEIAEENELNIDGADSNQLDNALDGLRDVLTQDSEGLDLSSSEASAKPDIGEDLMSDLDSDFGDDSTVGNDFDNDLVAGGSANASGIGIEDASPAGLGGQTSVTGATGTQTRADLVLDIPIDVQVVLGTRRMQISELMDLTEGATIGLERKIGEPVEIVVNGKLIGRGEITVLENDDTKFGVKMIEVIGSKTKSG